MKTLTIGYIGNGKSANRYHLPFVLQRKEKLHVKSVYSPHLPSQIWKEWTGIHYTDKVEEVLGDPEIDLVVVCTMHDSHYQYAKAALEHGKNCLVEKPFMPTLEQAEEIFDLAESKGLYVSSYQNRRYDSDFLTVQKVINSGKLGELLEMEMHFDYYRPYIPEGVHEFRPEMSYLYGHGCHTFDQVISLFGEPDSIHYDVRQLLGQGRMNDYFDVDLYYGVVKVSVKSSYFRIKSRPSFVVYGKKGMFVKEKKDKQEEHLKLFYMPGQDGFGIDLPEEYGLLTYMDDEDRFHEEKVESAAGDYGRVYDGIYECIVNGKPPVITRRQVLLQMKILEDGVKNLK